MFDAICPLRGRLAPEWFPRGTNRAQPGFVEIRDERNRLDIGISLRRGH
jgi:hypothetical protein